MAECQFPAESKFQARVDYMLLLFPISNITESFFPKLSLAAQTQFLELIVDFVVSSPSTVSYLCDEIN